MLITFAANICLELVDMYLFSFKIYDGDTDREPCTKAIQKTLDLSLNCTFSKCKNVLARNRAKRC